MGETVFSSNSGEMGMHLQKVSWTPTLPPIQNLIVASTVCRLETAPGSYNPLILPTFVQLQLCARPCARAGIRDSQFCPHELQSMNFISKQPPLAQSTP